MKKASKITLCLLLITLISYGISFLIPQPVRWMSDQTYFHWTLANSVLYTLLHAGAAVLFLIGVRAYKAALRSAYSKIAFGVVLVGVGLAQVVLLNIFGLIQTPWVQYGGVMLPFVFAGLMIYFGVRSIARLVGVVSTLTRLRIVLPAAIVGVLVVSMLPHGSSSLPELFFDVANAISTWNVILYAASFGLVLKIKQHSGPHYTQSMAWLAMGLIGSVVITLTVLAGTFVLGEEPEGYLLDVIVITGGLLYLKAGHSFAKTEEL